VWKAERREPEVYNVNQVEEVLERKLWSAEKITIPAGNAKLVKVRTEGNWKGAGVVESLPLEEQEKGRKVLLPENAYDLSGSVQAVYVENHAEECVELGLMLLFIFLSITVIEGVKDWSGSPHQMYIPKCRLQPRMLSYIMPGEELFSFNKIEHNLTRNQGVWSIKECYVPKIRETSLIEVYHNSALARVDGLHQHADSRGPRVRCVLQDQHSIIVYEAVLQRLISFRQYLEPEVSIEISMVL